jgi:hypothetical protein
MKNYETFKEKPGVLMFIFKRESLRDTENWRWEKTLDTIQ